MKGQLETIVNNTIELKKQGQQLATGLDEAKTNITQMINDCKSLSTPSPSFCGNIDSSQLQQGANFSKVPDVESQLDSIKEVTDLDFVTAAEEV